jgi:hypothetical protein
MLDEEKLIRQLTTMYVPEHLSGQDSTAQRMDFQMMLESFKGIDISLKCRVE